MTWSGAAVIDPGRLIYGGRLGSAHGHSHAAVQIAVATDGQVLFTDAAGRSAHSRSGIIPSGMVHAVDAGPTSGIMIYLDPTSTHGRRVEGLVDRATKAGVSAWRAATRDLPEDLALPRDLLAAADAIIAQLIGPEATVAEPTSTHPAVASAIALMPDLLS